MKRLINGVQADREQLNAVVKLTSGAEQQIVFTPRIAAENSGLRFVAKLQRYSLISTCIIYLYYSA
jgi:hypothetical protein